MTDETARLRDAIDRISAHDAVEDAWVAKSFTDRVVVVAVAPGEPLPDAVKSTLADHDLRGANEVYGIDEADASFMGTAGAGSRHRFVDVRTRGEHRSYVLD